MQRLYLREFIKLTLVIALGLSSIFSLIDLIGRIDNFLPGKSSPLAFVLYAIFKLPGFFLYLLPMAVFICSLFTFSQASGKNEITAIKAAGGRLRDLFMPFVVTGIIVSCIAFVIGEFLVPDFSLRAAQLKNRLEGRASKSAFAEGALWLRDRQGHPVRIELFVPEEKTIYNISIFISDKSSLEKIIKSEKAVWNGHVWVLERASSYSSATAKTTRYHRMVYKDLEAPDLFSHEVKTADEMGAIELFSYMQRLKSAGFNNMRLFVDLNSRISFPLINAFMLLLGMSLSGRFRAGGGLFTAGIGLSISLLYWFGYSFALSMGYAGILPPLISAWVVPLLFGSVAVYMFIKTPE